MTTAPLRVILDCDTANEIDDQFAIAYALGAVVPFAATGHRIMLDAIRRPAGRARRDGVAERVPVLGGAG